MQSGEAAALRRLKEAVRRADETLPAAPGSTDEQTAASGLAGPAVVEAVRDLQDAVDEYNRVVLERYDPA